MKMSKYNYISESCGRYIIFNGLKLTCIILDEDEYETFFNFDCKREEEYQYERLGFYVKDNADELMEFKEKILKTKEENNKLYFRIYTTTACNAKCRYCYEIGMKSITMSIKNAEKIYEYIIKNYDGESEIGIEWFGGEPLLNVAVIDYLSDKMDEFSRDKNCKFWARLVTNGFLLGADCIKKHSAWHLTHVQITLDGLKENYEKIKCFNVLNAFDIVLDNIERLLEENIKVSIRLNYTEENVSEIVNLINYLGKRFNKFYPRITVYGKRIMYKQTDNSMISSENTDIAIIEACIKNNFINNIIDTILSRNLGCVANNNKAYMILPNGDIGKCSQAIADGDLVGNICMGINSEDTRKWEEFILPENCKKCKLLPLCNCGCRYEFLNNKNFCMISKKVIEYKLKKILEINNG